MWYDLWPRIFDRSDTRLPILEMTFVQSELSAFTRAFSAAWSLLACSFSTLALISASILEHPFRLLLLRPRRDELRPRSRLRARLLRRFRDGLRRRLRDRLRRRRLRVRLWRRL